jgi:5-methylcytosine-specific restriction endonuclease McrA
MPKRFCIERLDDGTLCTTLHDEPGQRCPPHQAAATQRRNQRPSSSTRGYDGEYQRNKPVVIAQGRRGRPCYICEKPFRAGQKITVEHIVPLRNGGTSKLANLAPAHSGCNTGWNRGK